MNMISNNKSKPIPKARSLLNNYGEEEINNIFYPVAKQHYDFYVEFVHHGNYKHGNHTRYICDRLMALERGETKRIIITCPPRHSKSMTVSETFPSWYMGRNPDKSVILASYGDELAKKFGRLNKQKMIEFGKDIFDLELNPYNASNNNWSINGHAGTMRSSGIMGSITGEGSHLLIVDDPIRNRQDANSPAYKKRLWDEWQNTLLTRLQPDGAIIVILTRWTEDDLVGRLLEDEEERKKWEVIHLPAIAEENDLLGREPGEPLWAEYGYDIEWAKEKKREVGTQTWTALYQGRPSPQEGSIVKRNWWKYYKEPPAQFDEIIQSWDCTFKDLDTSDFVVGQVWGRKGGNKYLIDMVRDRMGIVATIQSIKNMNAKHPKARTILIEDKANGTAVIEMLKGKIPGIVPFNPKDSKISRLQSVSPQVEAGNIYLPEGKAFTHDFVEEIAQFPNSSNDDIVDSFTMAMLRFDRARPMFIGRA